MQLVNSKIRNHRSRRYHVQTLPPHLQRLGWIWMPLTDTALWCPILGTRKLLQQLQSQLPETGTLRIDASPSGGKCLVGLRLARLTSNPNCCRKPVWHAGHRFSDFRVLLPWPCLCFPLSNNNDEAWACQWIDHVIKWSMRSFCRNWRCRLAQLPGSAPSAS